LYWGPQIVGGLGMAPAERPVIATRAAHEAQGARPCSGQSLGSVAPGYPGFCFAVATSSAPARGSSDVRRRRAVSDPLHPNTPSSGASPLRSEASAIYDEGVFGCFGMPRISRIDPGEAEISTQYRCHSLRATRRRLPAVATCSDRSRFRAQ